MTLGQKSTLAGDRSSGFDYMRLALAVSVVCWHTIVVTYGFDAQAVVWSTPQYRVLITGILPAFFALSGFLVAGSLERSKTLAGFLYLRAIRIFPALIVEITLSALLLGPALTAFSLSDYFTDQRFFEYFWNCVGYIHYELPGLFLHNPLPSIINGQLWTVPFELECYISLSLIAVLGITLRSRVFFVLVFLLVGYGAYRFASGAIAGAENLSGRLLVVCFLLGVAFYLERDRIPYSKWLGWGAIALSLVCFWVPNGSYLAPLPTTYATIFIGLTNPRRARLLESGDYSYGVFLYGFPIQQAVVNLNIVPWNGWLTCLVSLPIIFAVAVCSWHFWEKRMLGLRKYRKDLDRVFAFTHAGCVELLGRSVRRKFKLRTKTT